MSDQSHQSTGISPSMQLMQLIFPGAIAVQAIYVAAKLAIADQLEDGPMSSEDLALATQAHAPSLQRVLRALTTLGIFVEDAAGRFRQTDLSATLRQDHPASMRPWALMLGAPFVWEPSGDLYQTVLTGEPTFQRVHGTSFFEHLTTHPDDETVFNAAMGANALRAVEAVVEAYDFSPFACIMDVGGGDGTLLHGILSANPQSRGVLFDQPAMVESATLLRSGAMATRCECVEGDFFDAVPAGADVYILKSIIHDWEDQDALKILQNCRRAIPSNGRLLLIEGLMTSPHNTPTSPSVAFTDLVMMALTTGWQRTETEFNALLQAAGFSLLRVIPTAGSSSIIESQPS